MKQLTFLLLACFLFFSLDVLGQLKATTGEKGTLQNSGKGQQNNNTGLGTQKIYNTKKTTVNKNTTTKKTHIVNGINNGVNGDVNINGTPELTDDGKVYILDKIKKLQKDSNITSNKIMIFVSTPSNSGKFTSQLVEFLEKNGYDLDGGNIGTTPRAFEGLAIEKFLYYDNKTWCIMISIGNL